VPGQRHLLAARVAPAIGIEKMVEYVAANAPLTEKLGRGSRPRGRVPQVRRWERDHGEHDVYVDKGFHAGNGGADG
jgi:hypothetical protein